MADDSWARRRAANRCIAAENYYRDLTANYRAVQGKLKLVNDPWRGTYIYDENGKLKPDFSYLLRDPKFREPYEHRRKLEDFEKKIREAIPAAQKQVVALQEARSKLGIEDGPIVKGFQRFINFFNQRGFVSDEARDELALPTLGPDGTISVRGINVLAGGNGKYFVEVAGMPGQVFELVRVSDNPKGTTGVNIRFAKPGSNELGSAQKVKVAGVEAGEYKAEPAAASAEAVIAGQKQVVDGATATEPALQPAAPGQEVSEPDQVPVPAPGQQINPALVHAATAPNARVVMPALSETDSVAEVVAPVLESAPAEVPESTGNLSALAESPSSGTALAPEDDPASVIPEQDDAIAAVNPAVQLEPAQENVPVKV